MNKQLKNLSVDFAKNLRYILIITLLLVLMALLLVFGIEPEEEKSFNIEDKCGRFVNLFSHTINDEPDCERRCISKCDAEDYKFENVNFEIRNGDCNKCTCYCKD